MLVFKRLPGATLLGTNNLSDHLTTPFSRETLATALWLLKKELIAISCYFG
jgi:hypothetical protein